MVEKIKTELYIPMDQYYQVEVCHSGDIGEMERWREERYEKRYGACDNEKHVQCVY